MPTQFAGIFIQFVRLIYYTQISLPLLRHCLFRIIVSELRAGESFYTWRLYEHGRQLKMTLEMSTTIKTGGFYHHY